jgi:hypothetical protein
MAAFLKIISKSPNKVLPSEQSEHCSPSKMFTVSQEDLLPCLQRAGWDMKKKTIRYPK